MLHPSKATDTDIRQASKAFGISDLIGAGHPLGKPKQEVH